MSDSVDQLNIGIYFAGESTKSIDETAFISSLYQWAPIRLLRLKKISWPSPDHAGQRSGNANTELTPN